MGQHGSERKHLQPIYTGPIGAGQLSPSSREVANKMLAKVNMPLQVTEWNRAMASHPDREFVEYLLRGIREGFRIGYNHRGHTCRPASKNMLSARQNPQVVEEYLAKAVKEGRVIGPLNPGECPYKVSLWSYTKTQPARKWLLIVDLSAPDGQSVNDGIAKSLSSLSYIPVDDIVSVILHLGRGASWQKWMFSQPIETCRCTRMTESCWE